MALRCALLDALWAREDRPMALIDRDYRYVRVNSGYGNSFWSRDGGLFQETALGIWHTH